MANKKKDKMRRKWLDSHGSLHATSVVGFDTWDGVGYASITVSNGRSSIDLFDKKKVKALRDFLNQALEDLDGIDND